MLATFGLLIGFFFAGDVQWNGISHDTYYGRRPLVPVNGESFDVYLRAYRLDLTAVNVIVTDGATAAIPAVFDHDEGPYALWRATIPAMTGTTLSYYFELIDQDDVDYLSAAGLSDDEPVGNEFVIDRVTYSHAPAGCHIVTGGTLFKVWAPNAATAYVRGTFNTWGLSTPMTKAGDYFYRFVGGVSQGANYKYFFQPGDLWRTDARARRVNPSDGLNSIVVNPLQYVFGDSSWSTPSFEDMVCYELHIGTFAGRNDPAGNVSYPSKYRDVADRVAHLQELGVNMVLLMPMIEFPGDDSLGYNPINAFSVESVYGGPGDFKYMVDTLHQAGIGVMLDIVWNHFSPTDNYLWNYDSASQQIYYRVPDVQTPWGSQADFGRVEVREYFLDSARMMFDEYHLDGFRMDATDFMNIGANEAGGWLLMQQLNNLMDRQYVDKICVAEQLPNDAWVTRPTNLGGAGFDAQWHDPFVDSVRAAVFASAFGDPSMSWIASAINGDGQYLNGPSLFRYFQLHDEAGPGSGGSRMCRTIDTTFPHNDFYARSRQKVALGLTMMVPGIPAILMGDEWLEDTDVNANSANRINWQNKTTNASTFQFSKDAIAVRRSNAAFRASAGYQVSHVNEGGNVIGFQRYDDGGNVCFVVANFSNTDYSNYRIGLPQTGIWAEILNSQATVYEGNNVGNGGSITTDDTDYDGYQQSAIITIPQSSLLVFRFNPPQPPCPADTDGDLDVDLTDLSRLLTNFGTASGMTREQGDVDNDGDVDLTDLSVLLGNFGTTCA